jgi:hypothetical protein
MATRRLHVGVTGVACRYDTLGNSRRIERFYRNRFVDCRWTVSGAVHRLGRVSKNLSSLSSRTALARNSRARRAYSDSSPMLVYFFLAATTAAFGLWQTRFCYRLGRDSSKILLRLYLLSSLVFPVGSWTFDRGSRFWTMPIQNEFYPPDRVLEIGRLLVQLGAVFESSGGVPECHL